jgi:hypothetical protein
MSIQKREISFNIKICVLDAYLEMHLLNEVRLRILFYIFLSCIVFSSNTRGEPTCIGENECTIVNNKKSCKPSRICKCAHIKNKITKEIYNRLPESVGKKCDADSQCTTLDLSSSCNLIALNSSYKKRYIHVLNNPELGYLRDEVRRSCSSSKRRRKSIKLDCKVDVYCYQNKCAIRK